MNAVLHIVKKGGSERALPRTTCDKIPDHYAQEAAEAPTCEYVGGIMGSEIDAGEAAEEQKGTCNPAG